MSVERDVHITASKDFGLTTRPGRMLEAQCKVRNTEKLKWGWENLRKAFSRVDN